MVKMRIILPNSRPPVRAYVLDSFPNGSARDERSTTAEFLLKNINNHCNRIMKYDVAVGFLWGNSENQPRITFFGYRFSPPPQLPRVSVCVIGENFRYMGNSSELELFENGIISPEGPARDILPILRDEREIRIQRGIDGYMAGAPLVGGSAFVLDRENEELIS